MGFRNACYATCWQDKSTNEVLNIFEKYAEVQITTSRKKPNGDYETDFSGRVRFIGRSFEKIKELSLNEKDRLKLLEVEVQNRYDKEKKRAYDTYIVWDFELAESRQNNAPKVEVVGDAPALKTVGEQDWELPF